MLYKITTGRNRRDKEWKVITTNWEQFAQRLSRPFITKETADEYAKMPKEQRTAVKDVGGFVGGEQVAGGGARKNSTIKDRSIINLDVDGDSKHGKYPDKVAVLEALNSFGCSYVLHSTHSSKPEALRLRIIIPLDRVVTADEYAPIVLRIAEKIGLEYVDQTCRQPARLMFWPSVPCDVPYIYESKLAAPLQADKILGTYLDYTDASEWPGATEALRRATERKRIKGDINGVAEDPAMKNGVIGAFCSVYDIEGAIAAFNLPYKKYGFNRYSYAYGSSVGGAIIYNGVFLFSNHASDPCSLQCCNAFDLVRIHKFGNLDNGADLDTPMNRLPSYSAMVRLCDDTPAVRAAIVKQTVKAANAAFAGIEVPDDSKAAKRKETPKTKQEAPKMEQAKEEEPSAEWEAQLETRGRNLVPSPYNFKLILDNDEQMRGAFVRDTFAMRKCVVKAMPWDKPEATYPRDWSDADTSQLSVWMSTKYKLNSGKDSQRDALEAVLSANAIHPVRDWLDSLPEWDKTPRVEEVFIKYLGVADEPIARVMTRKHLTAAVARIYQPGIKYDQVLCLCGPEGIGKSTIINILSNGYFMDSDIDVGNKDGYQNLVGHWLIEMSEFADMEAKSVQTYKAFIASATDRYRPAYGRETIEVPRQCVFFGTTNEAGFLKGRTGNRRFWVLDCTKKPQCKSALASGELQADLAQIWAEAKHYYHKGERLYLDDHEEAQLKDIQTRHEDLLLDDNINIIKEFILCAKPENWNTMTIGAKRDWWRNQGEAKTIEGWDANLALTYKHKYISVKEIALVVFGQIIGTKSRYEDNNLYYICNHLDCLRSTGKTMRFGKEIGVQRAYEVIPEYDDFPV